jgi:hypothetical protein
VLNLKWGLKQVKFSHFLNNQNSSNMKKPFIFLSVILFFSFFLIANLQNDEESIIGSWAFEVPQAPWEYSKGKITFERTEDNIIIGKAVFNTGRELSIDEVTAEGGEVTFVTNVDGYRVTAVFTLDGDELAGHVQTDEGNMDFSAERDTRES